MKLWGIDPVDDKQAILQSTSSTRTRMIAKDILEGITFASY